MMNWSAWHYFHLAQSICLFQALLAFAEAPGVMIPELCLYFASSGAPILLTTNSESTRLALPRALLTAILPTSIPLPCSETSGEGPFHADLVLATIDDALEPQASQAMGAE